MAADVLIEFLAHQAVLRGARPALKVLAIHHGQDRNRQTIDGCMRAIVGLGVPDVQPTRSQQTDDPFQQVYPWTR